MNKGGGCSLTVEEFIALGIWIALGVVFYMMSNPPNKKSSKARSGATAHACPEPRLINSLAIAMVNTPMISFSELSASTAASRPGGEPRRGF